MVFFLEFSKISVFFLVFFVRVFFSRVFGKILKHDSLLSAAADYDFF